MNEDLRASLELVTTVASVCEKWNYDRDDWNVYLAREAQAALTDIRMTIHDKYTANQGTANWVRTEVNAIVDLSIRCERLGKYGVARGYLALALAREMAAQAIEKELK